MVKSQLERIVQKKLAHMFSGLEQDLDIQIPEEFKIKLSDKLCVELENLFADYLMRREAIKISRKSQSRQDVVNTINAIISDRVGMNAQDIEPKADLCDDLGYESLDRLELLLELEKTFVISIEDEKFEKAKTVEDIQYVVLKKLGL